MDWFLSPQNWSDHFLCVAALIYDYVLYPHLWCKAGHCRLTTGSLSPAHMGHWGLCQWQFPAQQVRYCPQLLGRLVLPVCGDTWRTRRAQLLSWQSLMFMKQQPIHQELPTSIRDTVPSPLGSRGDPHPNIEPYHENIRPVLLTLPRPAINNRKVKTDRAKKRLRRPDD